MTPENLAYLILGIIITLGSFVLICEIRHTRRKRRDDQFKQHIDRYRRGTR